MAADLRERWGMTIFLKIAAVGIQPSILNKRVAIATPIRPVRVPPIASEPFTPAPFVSLATVDVIL